MARSKSKYVVGEDTICDEIMKGLLFDGDPANTLNSQRKKIQELKDLNTDADFKNYAELFMTYFCHLGKYYTTNTPSFDAQTIIEAFPEESEEKLITDKADLENAIKVLCREIGTLGGKITDYIEEIIENYLKDHSQYELNKYSNQYTNNGNLRSYIWAKVQEKNDMSSVYMSLFLSEGTAGNTEGTNGKTIEVLFSLEPQNTDIDEETKKKLKNVIEIIKNEHNEYIRKKNDGEHICIIWDGKEDLKKFYSRSFEAFENYYQEFVKLNKIEAVIQDCVKEGHKQIVLTGAPGTGKTYNAEKYAKSNMVWDKKNAPQYKVQFHPSYDYTDFVEGIRPIQENKSQGNKSEMSFVKMDGHFKAFCRKVVEENIKAIKDAPDGENATLKTLKTSIDKPLDIIDKLAEYDSDNLLEEQKEVLDIFYGKPDDEDKSPRNYYFIIDEINRADISKVFGELMYGFEYRDISKRFPTQYQNLKTYNYEDEGKDCFAHGFFIPKNVIIIGTMNDIDKSVESFDFAMRRRFQWRDIKANDVMKPTLRSMFFSSYEEYKEKERGLDDLCNAIEKMNEAISNPNNSYRLTEAYHIGPAYFKNYSFRSNSLNKTSLGYVFDNNIAQILREYVRGQARDNGNDFVKKVREAAGLTK